MKNLNSFHELAKKSNRSIANVRRILTQVGIEPREMELDGRKVRQGLTNSEWNKMVDIFTAIFEGKSVIYSAKKVAPKRRILESALSEKVAKFTKSHILDIYVSTGVRRAGVDGRKYYLAKEDAQKVLAFARS